MLNDKTKKQVGDRPMLKNKNQGLTLIELILGMAISSIIIGAIIIFMSTSTKGYKAAESEISLQTEAQSIMNQISECVLEGNNVKYDGNSLTIYHSDGNAATETDKVVIIWFNSTNHNMYLYNTTEAGRVSVMNSIGTGTVSEENLMGEYVKAFTASPDRFTYDRTGKNSTTLTIDIKMEYNNRKFSATQAIKLRNKIVNIP